VRGDKQNGDVSIRPRNAGKAVALQPVSTKDKLLSAISAEPRRPDNHEAKYEAALYSSKHPFCECK
jgi:hypothetical protein